MSNSVNNYYILAFNFAKTLIYINSICIMIMNNNRLEEHMYRIAICDDDNFTVEYITDLISKKFQNYKLFKFDNPIFMEFYIQETLKGEIDILIVDIKIGIISGIEIANRLKKLNPQIRIIFLSQQINFAEDIFEIKPTYFLVKPINKGKLFSAIMLATEDIETGKKETITINTRGCILNLELRKIKHIESSKRTVTFYENKSSREAYVKLDDISKLLSERFCRCHQSFIVNFDYVVSLNSYHLILNCGKEIPVSQSRYKEVKQNFLKYLGGNI
jgi:two-component system response regulator LytT